MIEIPSISSIQTLGEVKLLNKGKSSILTSEKTSYQVGGKKDNPAHRVQIIEEKYKDKMFNMQSRISSQESLELSIPDQQLPKLNDRESPKDFEDGENGFSYTT